MPTGESQPTREDDEIDVRAAIGVSFEIYRQYFVTLLLLALVLILPVAVAGWQQRDSEAFTLILFPISLATEIWFTACAFLMAKPVEGGGKRTFSDLISQGWPFLLPLIALTIVADVPTAFGFVLLIIPGLFLSLMWLVAFPVMMFEGRSAFVSMRKSSAMTRGHRMNLIWISLIVWVPRLGLGVIGYLLSLNDSLGGTLGYSAVNALLVPFQSILLAVTYFGLIALKEPGGSGSEVDQLEADVGTFDDRASHRLEG